MTRATVELCCFRRHCAARPLYSRCKELPTAAASESVEKTLRGVFAAFDIPIEQRSALQHALLEALTKIAGTLVAGRHRTQQAWRQKTCLRRRKRNGKRRCASGPKRRGRRNRSRRKKPSRASNYGMSCLAKPTAVKLMFELMFAAEILAGLEAETPARRNRPGPTYNLNELGRGTDSAIKACCGSTPTAHWEARCRSLGSTPVPSLLFILFFSLNRIVTPFDLKSRAVGCERAMPSIG